MDDVEREVRANYERFNAGDHYALLDHCDPGVRLRDRTLPDVPDEVVGLESCRRYIDHLVEAFDGLSYVIEEVVSRDDRLLMKVRASGSARSTGVDVSGMMGHVVVIRGGKVTQADVYGTWGEAVEATSP